MGRMIDLTGKEFGRLSVICRYGVIQGEAAWKCRCACGKEAYVRGYYLRSGVTQSCGCLHREISSGIFAGLTKTHGRTKTREHVTWVQMRQRCSNPNHHAWKWYGGKGVTVCERWVDSFENFVADMGPRPQGSVLDRIDSSRGYEPGNCRWIDRVINNLRALPHTRHLVEVTV